MFSHTKLDNIHDDTNTTSARVVLDKQYIEDNKITAAYFKCLNCNYHVRQWLQLIQHMSKLHPILHEIIKGSR